MSNNVESRKRLLLAHKVLNLSLIKRNFLQRKFTFSCRKGRDMKKIIVALILLLFCGCAHIGTVRTDVSSPSFQEQCQPIRVVRCIIFSDGTWSNERIKVDIKKASDSFERQVGIRLKILEFRQKKFISMDWLDTLREMENTMERPGLTSYDMAIAFASFGSLQAIGFHTLGFGYMGCIDSTYRRYVVIKHLDYRIILHEVSHAFVLDHAHSLTGSLASFPLKFPILSRVFNMSEWLTPSDRQEVLKNKWRHFN